MTTHFYNTAFLETLDKFIGSYDDPHADRFARWTHQKLTGTGSSVWDEDEERASRSDTPITFANGRAIVGTDRSSAHAAAWHSPKRPANEVGRHFQLDECFWAMREVIGDINPVFTEYYNYIASLVTLSMYTRAPLQCLQESRQDGRRILRIFKSISIMDGL